MSSYSSVLLPDGLILFAAKTRLATRMMERACMLVRVIFVVNCFEGWLPSGIGCCFHLFAFALHSAVRPLNTNTTERTKGARAGTQVRMKGGERDMTHGHRQCEAGGYSLSIMSIVQGDFDQGELSKPDLNTPSEPISHHTKASND